MVGIIDTLFGVGQKLFGLRMELSKARLARKSTVADFLDSIAESIEDVSVQLKANIYPHGKCHEILMHSRQIETAIGDLIGESSAHDLSAQLDEVHQIEKLYAELSADTEVGRQEKLIVLDQAAGQFRATAAYVRVSR
ncbi:MAG: hypothetical protein ABI644_02970 [Arenimonas sp.]